MNQLMQLAVSLMLITVMNVFVLGAHTSAMSATSVHQMSGMQYKKVFVPCVTVCISTASNKLSQLEIRDNEDDYEPSQPFYISSQQSMQGIMAYHTATAREVIKFEPPPGAPAYIRYSVFRT